VAMWQRVPSSKFDQPHFLAMLQHPAFLAQQKKMPSGGKTMRYVTVQVCVDESTIAAGDLWAVIEPVWWSANLYDGPDAYERSLRPFSRSQRLILAVRWYCSEVSNGGHDQFYRNSTGIVWKDALEAFRVLDAHDFVSILEQSAKRLGGAPSLDHHERSEQM